ncbi:hypothetical protein OJ588_06705 [Streptococcus anginosus]|nr:hypothetical protein [Streptococcus anginosus]
MTIRSLGARNCVDKVKGLRLTGSQAKSCRLSSIQFLAKQKLAILTASKKGHLGQRPKNDGTSKR